MLQVIIMSGISGAGKDTWIKKFQEANPDTKTFVVSADSYFMKDVPDFWGRKRVYDFNPSKLGEAHNACLRDFIQHVRNYIEEDGVVFVNNTNTTSEEIAPYYAIASAYGAEVELVTVYALPHIAAKRNVHGVPEKGILAMHDRIKARKIPCFWNISCSDNLNYMD